MTTRPDERGDPRLRALRPEDAAAIAEACRRGPDIVHYTMRLAALDEEAAAAWIAERLRREREGESVTRAIIGPTAELDGVIWLARFDDEARRGELTYWVAPWARGRGIAIAGVRLMAAFAFEHKGLLRVDILVPMGHNASEAVAVGAGFTREGVLRMYRRIAGEHRDIVIFSLLATDETDARAGGRAD